jgi:hypothetical protein
MISTWCSPNFGRSKFKGYKPSIYASSFLVEIGSSHSKFRALRNNRRWTYTPPQVPYISVPNHSVRDKPAPYTGLGQYFWWSLIFEKSCPRHFCPRQTCPGHLVESGLYMQNWVNIINVYGRQLHQYQLCIWILRLIVFVLMISGKCRPWVIMRTVTRRYWQCQWSYTILNLNNQQSQIILLVFIYKSIWISKFQSKKCRSKKNLLKPSIFCRLKNISRQKDICSVD